MDGVGDGLQAGNARWSFGGKTALQFDDHVSKSVPMYTEGHQIVCDLSDFFLSAGSTCYELGCSTGELTMKLGLHNQGKDQTRFVGIDLEPAMIDLAKQKTADLDLGLIDFVVDDVLQADISNADLVVAYYTVQFIRPSERQRLIDRIYSALNWGGAFLLFEKVRANDARFQDITTSLYNEYKIAQGYSPEEIFSKSRSLKGVLEPFSTQGNLDLMARAGFQDVLSIFKYLSFEGFLAIK
jgi:tRNA (cmo5U34)-methyltransferase